MVRFHVLPLKASSNRYVKNSASANDVNIRFMVRIRLAAKSKGTQTLESSPAVRRLLMRSRCESNQGCGIRAVLAAAFSDTFDWFPRSRNLEHCVCGERKVRW